MKLIFQIFTHHKDCIATVERCAVFDDCPERSRSVCKQDKGHKQCKITRLMHSIVGRALCMNFVLCTAHAEEKKMGSHKPRRTYHIKYIIIPVTKILF